MSRDPCFIPPPVSTVSEGENWLSAFLSFTRVHVCKSQPDVHSSPPPPPSTVSKGENWLSAFLSFIRVHVCKSQPDVHSLRCQHGTMHMTHF